jgi:mycothiol synthase
MPQAATRVWETETGQFAGYALINYGETYASLAFEYPEFAGSEIGDLMIAWGEQVYVERFHGNTEELNSPARDALPERIALLEKHGFTREPESQLLLERSLAEPIAEPHLPPGFTIRPATGDIETEVWVALHRAAFGTRNMTVEGRRAMTSLPDYDSELDLVAVAPDGTLAAYVFGSFNSEEMSLCGVKIGFTDPVATHPDYQRRGLSRALLLESMRRMKARGLETARLGTSSENIAMQKTAQSVGYCIVDRAWHYGKKLRYPVGRLRGSV